MPADAQRHFTPRQPRLLARCVALTVAALATAGSRAAPPPAAWEFSVAGDSRNCGNLVMPAIAAAARSRHAAFYWHLGDLRRGNGIDEDFASERRFQAPDAVPTLNDYAALALPDFVEHQVRPFGDMPFFVGIGNHETAAPATRLKFRTQLRELLDRPELRAQRHLDAADAPVADALPPTYYHWRRGRVEFIYLDNASDDAFDETQLAWLDGVLQRDAGDRGIRSIVVGMHEALPHSLADFHSMCATAAGVASGERVYQALVRLQKAGKSVYVLASHSHFYLANIFDTPYWRASEHGGVVLKGWIIGTAGAVRYPLPPGVAAGPDAQTLVYGYVAGLVGRDGEVRFEFHAVDEADLRRHRLADLPEELVDVCLNQNPRTLATLPARTTACDAEH